MVEEVPAACASVGPEVSLERSRGSAGSGNAAASDNTQNTVPTKGGTAAASTGLLPMQRKVRLFYNSSAVQMVITIIILINFLSSAARAQLMFDRGEPAREGTALEDFFFWAEIIFAVIFVVDLLCNVYAHFGPEFVREPWNIFDFIVIVVTLLAIFFPEFPVVSVLRLFRAFRAFRLFKRVRELQAIAVGALRSLPGVSNAFLILGLICGIWSILAVELFGNDEFCAEFDDYLLREGLAEGPQCKDWFGTFLMAALTVIQVSTFDSWSSGVTRPMILSTSSKATQMIIATFFITYVFISSIIMMNVVVAILLDKFLSSSSQEDGAPKTTTTDDELGYITPLTVRKRLNRTLQDIKLLAAAINRQHMPLLMELDKLVAAGRAAIDEEPRAISPRSPADAAEVCVPTADSAATPVAGGDAYRPPAQAPAGRNGDIAAGGGPRFPVVPTEPPMSFDIDALQVELCIAGDELPVPDEREPTLEHKCEEHPAAGASNHADCNMPVATPKNVVCSPGVLPGTASSPVAESARPAPADGEVCTVEQAQAAQAAQAPGEAAAVAVEGARPPRPPPIVASGPSGLSGPNGCSSSRLSPSPSPRSGDSHSRSLLNGGPFGGDPASPTVEPCGSLPKSNPGTPSLVYARPSMQSADVPTMIMKINGLMLSLPYPISLQDLERIVRCLQRRIRRFLSHKAQRRKERALAKEVRRSKSIVYRVNRACCSMSHNCVQTLDNFSTFRSLREANQRLSRIKLPFQHEVAAFYVYPQTQFVVAGLIFVNYFVSIVKAELTPLTQTEESRFFILEAVFGFLFAVELLINVYGHFWWGFWRDLWNLFDFSVVVVSILAVFYPDMPGLSVLRLFKCFRAFRLFRRLKSLQKIVVGVFRALPRVSYAFVILVLIMGIWSIIGIEFFGEEFPDLFGNFLLSMLTMFQVMTFDSWSSGVARPVVVRKNNKWIGLLFFGTYVFAASIFMMNAVVAILIDKFLKATDGVADDSDEEEDVCSTAARPVEADLADIEFDITKALVDVKLRLRSVLAVRGYDSSVRTDIKKHMQLMDARTNLKNIHGVVVDTKKTDIMRDLSKGLEKLN